MFFNSPKIRSLWLVAILVIAIISGAAWYNFAHQKKMIVDIAEKNSVILVESILASIQSSMKLGHLAEVNDILSRIKSHENIKTLRVVNNDGKILNSSNMMEIGQYLSPAEREAIANHPEARFNLSHEVGVFNSFSKIANAPECQGCHAASKPYIGHLETEFYLSNLNYYIKNERVNAIVSAVISIILIIGSLFAFLKVYSDSPFQLFIRKIDPHSDKKS